MSSTPVLPLEVYRGRRRQRLERSLALLRPDPVRGALAVHLGDLLEVLGADRAAVCWTEDYGAFQPRAHLVLDVQAERPRMAIDARLLREAWEQGIPGAVDIASLRRAAIPDHPRSAACVALGSDGERAWFVVVDTVRPRPPLTGDAWERLLYLSGECAAILLNRGLLTAADTPGRIEAFDGWPALAGLAQGGTGDARLTSRFLVLRFLRRLLDDDLQPDPELAAERILAVRKQLPAASGEEAECWHAVLNAAEAGKRDVLARASLDLGLSVDDRGELDAAIDALESAYWIAALSGEAETAVDAARFLGRACRKAGRWDGSEAWYECARQVAAVEEFTALEALALDGRASTLQARGNTRGALRMLDEALDVALASGDAGAQGSVHQHLMTLHFLAGDGVRAVEHGWAAVSSHQERRDRLRALVALAGILLDLGLLDLAEEAYTLALQRVDEGYFRAFAVEGHAHLAALRGDRKLYEERYRAVTDMGWSIGGIDFRAQAHLYRGRAYAALGDVAEARRWFERTVAFAEETGLNSYIFKAEEGLAQLGRRGRGTRRPARFTLPSETLGEVRGGLGRLRQELAGASA